MKLIKSKDGNEKKTKKNVFIEITCEITNIYYGKCTPLKKIILKIDQK
jgi:hypothetical protein